MTKYTKKEIEKKIQDNLLLMQDRNLHDLAFVRLSEQNMRLTKMLDQIKKNQ